jgi:hypothetical protein
MFEQISNDDEDYCEEQDTIIYQYSCDRSDISTTQHNIEVEENQLQVLHVEDGEDTHEITVETLLKMWNLHHLFPRIVGKCFVKSTCP